jgi:hypothetical protein
MAEHVQFVDNELDKMHTRCAAGIYQNQATIIIKT